MNNASVKFVYKFLYRFMFSFLLGICLGVELLGHRVTLFNLRRTASIFSTGLYQFIGLSEKS